MANLINMRQIVATLVALTLCGPSVTVAQTPTYKISGVIKKIDGERGIVTISRKGATEDETFSFLKKDIEVSGPNGQKAQIRTLAVGQMIQLTIGLTGDVEAVFIQAPAYLATIAEVDPKKRTIQIARAEKQLDTLPVAAEAKILLGTRYAFLREIKTGSEMSVTASLDGKTVLGLKLVSHPDGKLAAKLYPRVKVSKLPGVRYVGVLTDVDAVKNELHLSGPKTKFAPARFAVAKDAVIQALHGQVAVQDVPLKQLAKMTNATVLVSAENRATRIFVTPPTVAAKVKKLTDDGGLLTVHMSDAEKTFEVPADLKVMNGTRVLRLTDLEANLPVNLVLSMDRERLLAVDLR